jgi:hypothetical protein
MINQNDFVVVSFSPYLDDSGDVFSSSFTSGASVDNKIDPNAAICF